MLDRETADQVIGDSILFGEAIAVQLRKVIINLVRNSIRKGRDVDQIVGELSTVSVGMTPAMAEAFWRSDLVAWMASFNFRAATMPPWLQRRFIALGQEPPDTPIASPFLQVPDDPKRVRFPKLENAVRTMLERRIVTRKQFDELSDKAAVKAFTIAGDVSEKAIGKVRDKLAKSLDDGTGLQSFKADEVVQKTTMGPGHLENVFRTNAQAAFRDGDATVMANPIVARMFPYQAYLPIHDGRVREEHLALGELGLDGTNVYRRDDPFWDLFTPPWGFQCRCGTNP